MALRARRSEGAPSAPAERPRSTGWPKAAACLVVLTAVLVLVGWALDVTALKSVAPGWAPMRPSTALCFILLGSALWLLHAPSGPSETPGALRKVLGQACAGLAMLVGAVSLGEHLFRFDIGIDDLFLPEAVRAGGGPFPARMAPVSAAESILMGLALLRMKAESHGKGVASQHLALAGVFIGCLVLLGYAYGAPALYRIAPFSAVALHTALLFVLLGVAVLGIRPEQGLMAPFTGHTLGGHMARRMLPVALSLPFLLGWLRLQGERAGWYGAEFGLAVFAASNALAFAALVWLGARSLNTAEAQRQQANERLRQSEERLRLAMAGARLGPWHWDLGSGELVWSEQCLALFGVTPRTAVTYDTFVAALHPEDRAGVDAAVRHALDGRTNYDVEYRIVWPDGTVHWLNAKGRGYYDAAGRPLRMEGVVLDISERKQAEEIRARLAAIVEGSEDAIIGKTLESTITSWNRGAERLFGYAAKEAVGQAIWVVIPPERLDEEARLLARLRRGEHVRHYETVRRHKNGRVVDVSLTMSPIADGAGRIAGAATIARDITERKRAEQALRESNRFNEQIIQGAQEGIIVLDRELRYLVWNPYMERVSGAKAGDVIGRHALEVFPHLEALGLYAHLERALAGEYLKSPDTLMPLPHRGRPVWIAAEEGPLYSATGVVTGVIVTIHEITERKEAEAELKALNETLERRVRERTAEAVQANRRKSEFLAHMSHELRTPLNAIIGFSEVLADEKAGPLNAKQKDYLGDVLSSGRHLLRLINDVLDMAKVEAGKMELRLETFPLAKALGEVCAVVKAIADQKGVTLTWAVAPELGAVALDGQKLKQICYNLLSNAVKFTDSPGRVELTAAPQDECRFELQVKDTGRGIKPEDLPRLFSTFEQLEPSASHRFEGTGLGLALTKRLVELQGGSITVESRYGQGSTFAVVLPRRLVPEDGREG
ncbi:MAG: PAS domain S-box protein [Verrucomicrobia bacterium]|nr:PAS domain S-box protein [Verrucomicrobiota bacterium]